MVAFGWHASHLVIEDITPRTILFNRLQCKESYYTLYLVTWPSSKKSHYLAKREGATLPNCQRSEMLQCLPGDKKYRRRQNVCETYRYESVVSRKGVQLFLLHSHHTPIYHVMERRGEKWDCLQTNTLCDETKLQCWRENCMVYFSITRPVNVQSFFTNYAVLFVNQAELYGRKCSTFVAIRTDCAHMPVCRTSRTNDLLGDASNLSPISCSFPQHLLLHAIMLSRSESML